MYNAEVIDRGGAFWNGYTWVDQTTYVETATTDARDRMLCMEAERMDRCLYHAQACESERVVISELQGGENDPDRLLNIEVTATAVAPMLVHDAARRTLVTERAAIATAGPYEEP